MSNYKSKEFVPSDSSSDEDENVKPKVKTPEVSPVKEKKQKKEKKAKKNKEEVRFRSYLEPLRPILLTLEKFRQIFLKIKHRSPRSTDHLCGLCLDIN